MTACRWVRDASVPGGRFLVPGCMNRAINGDYAECHCDVKTRTDVVDEILNRLDRIERQLRAQRKASDVSEPVNP